jgi:large subunit ribosomal protein L17
MAHARSISGRKFHREKDQRRALMKGLASNLIEHESITTTHEKAKELSSYIDKLITKAKLGDLHSRRMVLQKVAHEQSAHKLVDELAPKMGGRNSGYTSILKVASRRGDNARMSTISFVDEMASAPVSKKAEIEVAKPKPSPKAKKEAK